MTDTPELPQDGWLIHKAGRGWYRPNAQGYTGDPSQAGRYTHEDALSYSHPNGLSGPRDGMTIRHESQVNGACKPNPTPPADLVEAVARALFDDLEQYSPDPSSWDDICFLEKLPWKRSAEAAIDTAAPLIRAQIADNLDAMRRDETNWPQVIARLIREGKV